MSRGMAWEQEHATSGRGRLIRCRGIALGLDVAPEAKALSTVAADQDATYVDCTGDLELVGCAAPAGDVDGDDDAQTRADHGQERGRQGEENPRRSGPVASSAHATPSPGPSASCSSARSSASISARWAL